MTRLCELLVLIGILTLRFWVCKCPIVNLFSRQLEADFASLKEAEESSRREVESRRAADRVQAMKRKEVNRITEERRREDERRRTQEIKFSKEDMEAVRLKLNGDYSEAGGAGAYEDEMQRLVLVLHELIP